MHTYSFLAVTGTADPTTNQVPSRIITSTPPPQHIPITTTGRAQTLPTQATGSIILYNEAPYYQTIQAGTVITGNDGIQIVSDQSVTLAPGNGTTNGSALVYAHTIQAGTQANISPFDINRLCCLSGILAKNTSYFYGGKDPQTYPIVSSSDIQQAEKHASSMLHSLAQSALAKQIQPQEKTLIPVTCSLNSLSDPKIGQRTTRATVTVTETCTTQVFNFTTLQEKSRANYIQDAGTTLGSAYISTGIIAIAITKHTLLDTRHKTYTLSVSATGQLLFKPSASQIQTIKKHIAGMRMIDAKRLLLATMQAVQGIDIQPSNTSDNTLPVDPNQIDIKIFS